MPELEWFHVMQAYHLLCQCCEQDMIELVSILRKNITVMVVSESSQGVGVGDLRTSF